MRTPILAALPLALVPVPASAGSTYLGGCSLVASGDPLELTPSDDHWYGGIVAAVVLRSASPRP